MTRDDSTGGWVPMGGGGLSNVSVRKRLISEEDQKPEYIICGKRISDQTVVLSCSIRRDFIYNKVMPTFHHWRTGEKKFGLTFQTAADARAFDKGVRTAVEDLLEGVGYGHNSHGGDDLGDDEVFMTLDLPVESRSSSGSSSGSANGVNTFRPTSATSSIPGDTFSVNSSPYSHPHSTQQQQQQQHLYRLQFMKPSRTMPGVSSNGGSTSGLTSSISIAAGELQKVQGEEIWVKEKAGKEPPPNNQEKIELLPYSYVSFAKERPEQRAEHDYCYPAIETLKSGRQDYPENLKKQVATVSSEPPLLPSKKKGKDSRSQPSPSQSRCRLCLDTYGEEDNRPGSCRYGRDRTLSCINHATCLSCAQCMLYHCMSDAEGDFHHHPCSCDSSDDHCRRRWTGLALLSIFVPCLWCYLPLRACHRCGVSCGYCGGQHEPEYE
nr:sprouty-related, EVH1 domain-containing protein 2 isoform X2 [Parasteatoda tepidariorum]